MVRDAGVSGTKDADLAEAASQLLKAAVDVPSDTVKAGVHDHAITLSGTVTWQYQREAAARAVMYLRGVTAVANTISLASPTPFSGPKTAIEAAVLRNAQLDSREITVDVNGGEVTLGGTVRSFAERRQAEYVAWSAAGVACWIGPEKLTPSASRESPRIGVLNRTSKFPGMTSFSSR